MARSINPIITVSNDGKMGELNRNSNIFKIIVSWSPFEIAVTQIFYCDLCVYTWYLLFVCNTYLCKESMSNLMLILLLLKVDKWIFFLFHLIFCCDVSCLVDGYTSVKWIDLFCTVLYMEDFAYVWDQMLFVLTSKYPKDKITPKVWTGHALASSTYSIYLLLH